MHVSLAYSTILYRYKHYNISVNSQLHMYIVDKVLLTPVYIALFYIQLHYT